jgi:hypothetical protein
MSVNVGRGKKAARVLAQEKFVGPKDGLPAT